MTETLSIPLNKLVPWDGNVRKTGVSEGIEELSASIAAHGLLQSPIVRKIKGGKYAVVAGQRRLLALKLLAEKQTIAHDMDVLCQLVAPKADAGEISLAENVVRVAMHPADQFEAFRDLVDRGVEVADVATRFGVTQAVVAKRLKLGRLSPVVLEAYRNSDIDLEEAQAFSISDDHAAQERVLADLSDWQRSPSSIRRQLTEGEIPATDKRVRFVGLEAYESAGGAVRRDLFDDDASGTIIDQVLLNRLAAEKLSAVADQVRAEGWAWVEVHVDFDRSMLPDFRRAQPVRVELSEDLQKQSALLAEEYDKLADSAEADDCDEAVLARLREIEELLEAIDEGQFAWPAEVLVIAGAIVTLAWDGSPDVLGGLIRPGDEPEVVSVSDEKPRKSSGISASLVEALTTEKSSIMSRALSGNPEVALAAIVHALALHTFYRFGTEQSCLQIDVRVVRHGADEDDTLDNWAARLPEDPAALWTWCLEQPQEILLAFLAQLAGQCVDAVQRKFDRHESSRLSHGDALARALGVDMTTAFMPSVENYFSRISRAQIVSALCEAKGVPAAPSWSKMKKAELAAFAAREIVGTGWLPEPMRLRDERIDEAA
jgi:ParB family transcriptional regulator, chromosome partitioning protein